MYKLDDPDEMTPDERFKKIARYLASGFLHSNLFVSLTNTNNHNDDAWHPNRTFIIASEKLVTDE